MPLPLPVAKVVCSGTMASGVQDMSFGLYIDAGFTDFISQATLEDFLDAIKPTYNDFLFSGHVKNFWTASDQFTTLKAYFIPATGDTATLVAETTFTSPLVGTGTANHPLGTALVLSNRSLLPGKSGRGRIYLPANGVDATSSDRVASDSVVDALGTDYLTFLNALRAGTFYPGIASFTKSLWNQIHTYQIDNKFDTQRRRGDQIAASHTKTGTVT